MAELAAFVTGALSGAFMLYVAVLLGVYSKTAKARALEYQNPDDVRWVKAYKCKSCGHVAHKINYENFCPMCGLEERSYLDWQQEVVGKWINGQWVPKEKLQ